MMTPSPDQLYDALLSRNPAYDGLWVVGVRTTGIFCRLTCPARKPKRENTTFFDSPAAAQAAGFRPCLRCRPLDPSACPGGTPARPWLADLRRRVEAEPDRRWGEEDLRRLGLDPSTVRRAFRQVYGTTFARFARSVRLGAAVATLKDGATVIDAQLEAGYESASGFRDAITRLLGAAPARLRDQHTPVARWLETPIGAMLAIGDQYGLHLLEFFDRTALPTEIARLQTHTGPIPFGTCPMLETVAAQLSAWFRDARSPFSIPVVQRGSAFEQTVWAELQKIPPGETRTYGGLARGIGRPQAGRAVGRANGANQVAVIVPCHRVIGADGALTGYGGKLWRKQWLLEHERRSLLRLDPAPGSP
ncbi:bifunctional transcriptional activator/DNA repair enzyme AdaA [Novispirillum itersonii]|uniref:bifunctional transcriptional activator/DNA repair enzyme AdaA n=1 Tax=Novispirillum itersonii TaxID=189 RepID=UPI00036AC24C|nr:trifunctional transcriptional activator/DNA repair protein Ada/methylated-DNA--[protein]-cysteine S-methyltransferase [Novispirillum itersonii]